MGKNKRRTKTKSKSMSLEEFKQSVKSENDIILPTKSIGLPNQVPETVEDSHNWRTTVSRERNKIPEREISWERGADQLTKKPESDSDKSTNWRRDTVKPTVRPAELKDKPEREINWGERREPTIAPVKKISRANEDTLSRDTLSRADEDTDWRRNSKSVQARKYRPPIRDKWERGSNTTKCF